MTRDGSLRRIRKIRPTLIHCRIQPAPELDIMRDLPFMKIMTSAKISGFWTPPFTITLKQPISSIVSFSANPPPPVINEQYHVNMGQCTNDVDKEGERGYLNSDTVWGVA